MVLRGATINVYLAGTTTAATIYTSVTSTTGVNSVTTSSTDGSFSFYVDAFDYGSFQKFKFVVSKPTLTDSTFTADEVSVDEVVTGTYTISTAKTVSNPVSIPYGVVFSKSGSGSINFSKSFQSGKYQIFDSTFSSGITFSGTSVEEVYPEWWGVTGTNDENAINSALTSVSTIAKPVVLSGTYNINTTHITLGKAMSLIGKGSVSKLGGTFGASLKTTLTNDGIINIGSGAYNTRIENIILESATLAAGQYGILGNGTVAGGGAIGCKIRNCNFYRLDKGIYCNPADGNNWQWDHVIVEGCQFNEGNTGVHKNSTNAQLWSIRNNNIAFLDYGVYLEKSTLDTIQSNSFNAVGGNLNNKCIALNNTASINIIGNQEESTTYFLYTLNTNAISNVLLQGNYVSDAASFMAGGGWKLTSIGNYYGDNFSIQTDSIVSTIMDKWNTGKAFVLATNALIPFLIDTNGKRIRFNITQTDDQSLSSSAYDFLPDTDTKLASLTPPAYGNNTTRAYRISYYFNVFNASTTVHLHVKYKSLLASAYDIDLVASASKTVGGYPGTDVTIVADSSAGDAIEVWGSASTGNTVLVKVTISPIVELFY